MYKNKKKNDFLNALGFSLDYKVDGVIVFGGWKKEKQMTNFIAVVEELYQGVKCTKFQDFLSYIIEVQTNGKIIWFTVQYGGALLSEYLHLACLFGSKTNILIGSCGGLSTKIKTNDLIIPTFSFGNESTTRMYQPNITNHLHMSNSDLSKKLKDRIDGDLNIFQGSVVTCQAMLGETWSMIQNWNSKGYLGVEMESSTLFAVSNYFNVKSAALLYVADNLIEQNTVLDIAFQTTIASDTRKLILKKMYSAALKTIVNE